LPADPATVVRWGGTRNGVSLFLRGVQEVVRSRKPQVVTLALALLALLGLAAVAPAADEAVLAKANFDKIKNGMTLKEVEAILGTADLLVKAPGKDEVKGAGWKAGKTKQIVVAFNNQKVVLKESYGLE
jgi:hypothetical protein